MWVGPGQFVFGRKSAAKELKMKPSTVRKRIIKLKNMRNCDIESNTQYSIISIVNWDIYQGKQKKSDIESDSQVTAKEQPSDTNNNDKNDKNGKEIKTSLRKSAKKSPLNKSQEKKFDRFWQVYPKRKSKGDAEKAFKDINPDDQLLETILGAIGMAKVSDDWLKGGGKYIPYPAKWLKAKGWEDEYIPVQMNVSEKTLRNMAASEEWKRKKEIQYEE